MSALRKIIGDFDGKKDVFAWKLPEENGSEKIAIAFSVEDFNEQNWQIEIELDRINISDSRVIAKWEDDNTLQIYIEKGRGLRCFGIRADNEKYLSPSSKLCLRVINAKERVETGQFKTIDELRAIIKDMDKVSKEIVSAYPKEIGRVSHDIDYIYREWAKVAQPNSLEDEPVDWVHCPTSPPPLIVLPYPRSYEEIFNTYGEKEEVETALKGHVETAKKIFAANPCKHEVVFRFGEGKKTHYIEDRYEKITTAIWNPRFDGVGVSIVIYNNDDKWEIRALVFEDSDGGEESVAITRFDTREEAVNKLIERVMAWAPNTCNEDVGSTLAYYWKGCLYDSYVVDFLAGIDDIEQFFPKATPDTKPETDKEVTGSAPDDKFFSKVAELRRSVTESKERLEASAYKTIKEIYNAILPGHKAVEELLKISEEALEPVYYDALYLYCRWDDFTEREFEEGVIDKVRPDCLTILNASKYDSDTYRDRVCIAKTYRDQIRIAKEIVGLRLPIYHVYYEEDYTYDNISFTRLKCGEWEVRGREGDTPVNINECKKCYAYFYKDTLYEINSVRELAKIFDRLKGEYNE